MEANPLWYIFFWSMIAGIVIEFIAVAVYSIIKSLLKKHIKKAPSKEVQNKTLN